MPTVQSKYFSVTAEIQSKTDTTATIKWSFSRRRGYFGYCNSNEALAIKGANGYKNHLGIPKTWKSSWGTRSKYLTDGKNHSVVNAWGSLKGICTNGEEYTETVTLDRGNQRSITKEIVVGVEGTKAEKANWEALVTLKVSTSEIKLPESISGIQVEVDDTMQDQRYIHLSLTYTNPDNYYTATLYDTTTGLVVATENVSTRPGYIGTDILITRDMFNDRKIYKCVIRGKDNKEYWSGTTNPIDILPSGLGVYFKNSGNAQDVDAVYFKNVNNKQVQKVYTKLNGQIIEIRK